MYTSSLCLRVYDVRLHCSSAYQPDSISRNSCLDDAGGAILICISGYPENCSRIIVVRSIHMKDGILESGLSVRKTT